MDLYYASQSFYPHIGGVSTSLLNLTKEMVYKGNRVVEVHLRPSGEANFEEIQGVEVHRVPKTPINDELMREYSKFKEAIYQASHFSSHQPVKSPQELPGFSEFHQVNQYFGEELRELIKREPADIVHIHDFQLLLAFQQVPRGTPLILSWHIPFNPAMPPLLKKFLIQHLREYDRVVFSSNEYIEAAVRAGLPPEKAELIYPIANTNLFKVMAIDKAAVKRRYKIPLTAKIILCVQRIDPKSGHRQLIEALPAILKKIPQAKLVFVGGESMSNKLSDERNQLATEIKELVQKLELENHVIFTGNVPYERLPELVNAADVCALCSRNEGFGLSVTEGMACGKPIVGTRVGGIPLQVRDGKNGFLVEVNDVDATANRLVRLLKKTALAEKMGLASLEQVESRFKIERGVEQHLMLYRNVQRSKKPLHRLEHLRLHDVKALITDLDRTLTDQPDTPEFNPRNYDADLLKALERLGIDLILATGRNFRYVQKLCKRFNIWRCVVAENGAVLYFPRTRKTILVTTPEMALARHRIKALHLSGTTLGKVITSSRLVDKTRIKRELGDLTAHLNFINNVNEVMVTPKGVDKGQGLRLAMQYLHINMDKTIVVGDGENDVDMFLNPGFKIALHNADLKLKKLANQTSRHPSTKGIWEILRTLQSE